MNHRFILLAGALAALGACNDRGRDDAAASDFSNRMDSGEVWREEQAKATGNRILPPFGSQPDATAVPATTVPPPATAPTATTATATGGGLPDGEYACYGSGSTVLAGLGFKVSGGNYTDLDGGNPGRVSVRGSNVVFDGGIHDDQDGRDFTGKGFRLGRSVVCEKW